MEDVHFYSNSLGRQMPYRVFLPTDLVAGERLPVVYLLHGGFGGFRDWSNETDVARYASRGLLLVMPEGELFSYYMNEVEDSQERYEDYITKDLIADVEKRFPVRSDRAGRAVVGVSMGGFAAVDYALTRPDLFVFAGAISPAIDVPSRRFSLRHAEQWWRFRTIFGPVGSEERKGRDPFELVKTADPQTTTYIYMTTGEREPLREPIERFAEKLKERGFAYEFHTKPGGHSWSQWDAQVPGCFDSLLKHLSLSAN